MTRVSRFLPGLCVALAVLAGCQPVAPGPIDGGNVGVTSGGSQDVAEARSQINSGYFPEPELMTVEGFFSEHDIPLTPPEDAPELYASVGLAWRQPFNEIAPGADVFVRLGSTIDVSQFERSPLNLVLVVDRSGSMNHTASATDFRSKLESVKQALHSLLDRLTPADRIAIVTFNTGVRVDLPSTFASDVDAIRETIDAIEARGDTDLHQALQTGFETCLQHADGTRDNRVIAFTDALPTAGAEDTDSFVALAESYAALDVGLTMMGVGDAFGSELSRRISNVRLGNSFFLADAERIASIFEEEFDYFVTPAAFDLQLEVTIPEGVGIRDVYGVEDYVPGSRGARVTIPTLFFSAREGGGGAIIVRLTFAEPPEFEQDEVIGSVAMSYTLRDGTQRTLASDLSLPAGTDPTGAAPYYSDEATRRAALLLDTVLVLREALDSVYENRSRDAALLLEEFLPYFDEASLGMSNRTDGSSRSLSDERDLVETLSGMLRWAL